MLNLYDFRNAFVLFGILFRNINLELVPVLIFHISQPFKMHRIIRIVVNCSHGSQLIKSFNKHTFLIQIGKSHWTMHCIHPFAFGPVFDSCKKCIGHLLVVDKIYKAKPGMFLFPDLVAFPVYNTRNTAHNPVVAQRQKIDCFTKLKSRIFIPA